MDDIVAVGNLGLVKAAKSFDDSKGFTFATYAFRVIQNEIFMMFRREKKQSNVISLDVPLNEDGDLFIMDTSLCAVDDDTDKALMFENTFRDVFKLLSNATIGKKDLKSRNIIIFYRVVILGERQNAVGLRYGLEQTVISRIVKKQIRYLKSKKKLLIP